MNEQAKQGTTLVLGGTGKTGRRVVERLQAMGLPVRIASRSGTPAFDWHDPSGWPAVLEGIAALYIAYQPDLAVPGAAESIRAITKLAVEKGVRKIVLLAGRGEPQVLPSEEAVKQSGAAYTILRCSWFCQNFDEGVLVDAIRAGELPFPGGDVAEPFIDVDDIADVAVAALTDDEHAGKTYELTGPRLLTFAEAVVEMGRAAGRDLRYVPITSKAFEGILAEHMPAEEASFLSDLFAFLLDGHNATITDGVERALGRKARDFRDYARDAAKRGAWRPFDAAAE